MNNNWLKYLVALSAILIAGSAAYFSVTGLGVLFSGAAIAVMVMASSLEFAKLVTATYLKQRWDEIKGFNKWYLSFAVTILMLITSAGIFGYLSNAFQQQNLALQQVDREIAIHTAKIEQNNNQITQLSTQITESNTNQGKILDNGKVNSRLLRSIDNRDKQIAKLNDKISKLQEDNAKENEEINKIKTDNLDLEKEVGGFRFVAEAFGVELNSVVKFFIILIVIVFDPLAIALVIAFNQLIMIKKQEDEIESKPEDLKDFVDETARLHLSENDLKILEETLLNPPPPNDELKRASEKYKEKMEMEERLIKMDKELSLHEDEYDENFSTIEPTAEEESENFSTIIPNTENTFQDNQITPALSDEEVSEMFMDEWEGKFDTENDQTETFTDEFISEAIDEFNQESIQEDINDFIPEPIVTHEEVEKTNIDVKQLDETLEIVNQEIDTTNNESPNEGDEKKKY